MPIAIANGPRSTSPHNPHPAKQFPGVDRAEKLNHAVDLVVVLSVRKACQLSEKGIEPRRLVRHVDLTALELGALL